MKNYRFFELCFSTIITKTIPILLCKINSKKRIPKMKKKSICPKTEKDVDYKNFVKFELKRLDIADLILILIGLNQEKWQNFHRQQRYNELENAIAPFNKVKKSESDLFLNEKTFSHDATKTFGRTADGFLAELKILDFLLNKISTYIMFFLIPYLFCHNSSEYFKLCLSGIKQRDGNFVDGIDKSSKKKYRFLQLFFRKSL